MYACQPAHLKNHTSGACCAYIVGWSFSGGAAICYVLPVLCRVCTGEAKVAYTPSDAPGASPARNRMLTIASLFICMIPTRDIFMNRWLINHVTCGVGEASGVVIGRSAGGRRCREEFVDSDWFRRAGRVTCLRHSKVWRHQSTCTL